MQKPKVGRAGVQNFRPFYIAKPGYTGPDEFAYAFIGKDQYGGPMRIVIKRNGDRGLIRRRSILAPVIPVDLHVFLGEIAGPDRRLAAAEAEIDADGDVAAAHVGRGLASS